MRGARASVLATATLAAALAPAFLSADATGRCSGSRKQCRPIHLPASITITTWRGARTIGYRIGRNGQARHLSRVPNPFPFPRAAVWFPGTNTWFRIHDRHLIVGRGRRSLWRSHEEIASPRQLGVVTLGPHEVAFQHDHKLYLAPLTGAERPVADRELPLGWTRGGLYTYRYSGKELLLRSETGALVGTLARRPLGSDYFVADGALYFIVRGVVMSALGPQVRRLASLRSLRMSGNPMLQSAGRLLELEDDTRLVVLRSNGSLFASTSVPRSGRHPETISSGLEVSPNGNAVAFTAAAGESGDPNTARRAIGTETVYLLRPGSHKAVAVHTEWVAFNPCERGAGVAWHGRWVLYNNSEGNLVVIDTSGTHPAIDLSQLARSLLGTNAFFDARWG